MIPQVLDFHRAFGLPVANSPALPDQDLRTLRKRLLAEEVNEVEDAEQKGDLIQIASELSDVCYIAAGTALTYGIAVPDMPRGMIAFRTDAAELDFEEFKAPFNPPWLPRQEIRESYLAALKKNSSDYEKAEDTNDLTAIAAALADIFQTCFSYASDYGINLTAVFEEVHSSNMTKLGDDGKPLRREDGKVLKGPNYRKHNVRAIIEPEMAVGHQYRHYKGGLYEVILVANLEATLEPAVVYRSLTYGGVWVRTCREFFSDVSVDGNTVKRFTRV
jgi:predicted HAD superfamily Cof-like phosphohydrolase